MSCKKIDDRRQKLRLDGLVEEGNAGQFCQPLSKSIIHRQLSHSKCSGAPLTQETQPPSPQTQPTPPPPPLPPPTPDTTPTAQTYTVVFPSHFGILIYPPHGGSNRPHSHHTVAASPNTSLILASQLQDPTTANENRHCPYSQAYGPV